ncbi:hypothetical protein AYO38_01940 [bacterium SCGC AG-212-C10]|nr:hypothetical protein AYO38_01940 [bacterium SCGC AG-212-C10]
MVTLSLKLLVAVILAATFGTSLAAARASDVEPAATDLTGVWNGTWTSTNPPGPSGTIRVEGTQSGTSLNGAIEITNSLCMTTGTLTGTIVGSAINFGVVQGDNTIEFNGNANGTALSGTWFSASCFNSSGTWEATITTTGPTPVIDSVSPAAVKAGGPGFVLSLAGSAFASGVAVTWDGTPLNMAAAPTETALLLTVTPDLYPAPKSITITVTNPGGGATQRTFAVRQNSTADADCDGDVDATDAVAVMRSIAALSGPPIPVVCQFSTTPPGDADLDGTITLSDALYVLRVVAGILPQ